MITSLLQDTFATGNRTGTAWVDLCGHAQRPGKGLETGLNDVVGVGALELTNVEGQAAVVDHGHEKLLDQLGVIATDLLAGNAEVVTQMGPAGTIERHLHQRLIEGSNEMTEANDASAVAEGLSQGLAHCNPDVFIGVVIIDVGVAHGIDLQINQAMAADLMQHVIQEGHASSGLALTAAIQIQANLHIGLAGHSMDLS